VDPHDRDRALDRDVTAAAAAHQRLLAHLDDRREAGDLDPLRPSRLPGWSVGHVLTHLARNADGHLRMLDGLPQYEGGAVGRQADIEAGADRPLDALVDDVRRSIWALEGRWATETDWDRPVQRLMGEAPARTLPALRRRETEIHLVDLGTGVTFADLPTDFLLAEFDRAAAAGLAEPPAVAALPLHDRVAWRLGRLRVPGVEDAPPF
jgi:maleylpyruvate isomerase